MHEELSCDNQAQDQQLDRDAMDARVEAQKASMDDSHTSGQLAQLVKVLGSQAPKQTTCFIDDFQ